MPFFLRILHRKSAVVSKAVSAKVDQAAVSATATRSCGSTTHAVSQSTGLGRSTRTRQQLFVESSGSSRQVVLRAPSRSNSTPNALLGPTASLGDHPRSTAIGDAAP